MEDIQTRIFFWSVAGIVGGIYLFFKGFLKLWEKRLIENIPTSKVRSIAMGLVELQGTAVPDVLLAGPYTKSPCVFYHIIIERFVRSKNSTYWVKELEMKTEIPFFIQDETGSVVVDPRGADTNLPVRYRRIEGHKRYSEYNIMEKETIYVLGTAKRTESLEEKIHSQVEARLKEIIKNPAEKQKMDVNKDMWIDENELEIARKKIKDEVIKEFSRIGQEFKNSVHSVPDSLKNIVIGKGELDKHFLLSNKSEKEMINSIKYRAFFYTVGGAILTLICLKIILAYI